MTATYRLCWTSTALAAISLGIGVGLPCAIDGLAVTAIFLGGVCLGRALRVRMIDEQSSGVVKVYYVSRALRDEASPNRVN